MNPVVFAKAWYVFTSPQKTEQDTVGEEPVPPVSSALPTMQPTPTPDATDARDVMFSQDSGYMSDVESPEQAEKELVEVAEPSITPDKSMPCLESGDNGGGEPIPGSSVEEQWEYAVTLQEPESKAARTICCFDELRKANKFARKVFHGLCDYRLGQAQLILTRSFRARCKPLEALRWFAGDGTVRLEWCDALGREGRVAVERQPVRVAIVVDAT